MSNTDISQNFIDMNLYVCKCGPNDPKEQVFIMLVKIWIQSGSLSNFDSFFFLKH